MIYIVRTGQEDGGYLKIGYSGKSVKNRVKKLQTGSPLPLDILGVLDGGILEEKELHKKLNRFRVRTDGEWFYDCTEIRQDLGLEINENNEPRLPVDKRATKYALNDMFKYRDYPDFPLSVSISDLSEIKGISVDDLEEFATEASCNFFIAETTQRELLEIFGKMLGTSNDDLLPKRYAIPKRTFDLVGFQNRILPMFRKAIGS
jgi:hypothetical protein